MTKINVGPVTDTIGELISPIMEDVKNLMNITNKRAPFFTLQYDFNEEVYRNTKFRQNSNHTLTGQIFHHQCAS